MYRVSQGREDTLKSVDLFFLIWLRSLCVKMKKYQCLQFSLLEHQRAARCPAGPPGTTISSCAENHHQANCSRASSAINNGLSSSLNRDHFPTYIHLPTSTPTPSRLPTAQTEILGARSSLQPITPVVTGSWFPVSSLGKENKSFAQQQILPWTLWSKGRIKKGSKHSAEEKPVRKIEWNIIVHKDLRG